MTGPEHYLEAERFQRQAETWENADTGWKADMSGEERIARRTADLTAALVHATLAGAAATALGSLSNGMPGEDFAAWNEAAGVPTFPGNASAR
jgi:hypothetical protein